MKKNEILAILDEVKNMLDYQVRHYLKYEDIPPTYKKNVLRLFMFIKQEFFPNGDTDKLKARRVGPMAANKVVICTTSCRLVPSPYK